MKTIIAVFSLMMMYSFISAQTCHGDNVMVYKGAAHCRCICKKKCVSPSELQGYLDMGWNTWGCFNCCWVNADDPKRLPAADINMATPGQPANALTVSFPPSFLTDVTIRVTDMTGRYVETVDSDFLEGQDHTLAWDNSGLNPGIYFLHINAGAAMETKMISVME